MLFSDKNGKILTLEEVNNLGAWEIDEREIHTYDKTQDPFMDDEYIEFS